ncbi:MAG: hypothetical protein M1453_03790 [Acidobacteria bacterium]|nr:hypothetical protein [Acidobacteriota bacterium]
MNRAAAHEISWRARVRTATDAVRFIDATGFCVLFPLKNVPLPSLYYACARRGIHLGPGWDKYCEMIWEWKDELPHRRRAYYSKCLRGRGMFVSVKLLPHFLAMRDSAAAASDYERFYAAGRISHDALVIWKVLEEHGPLATLELRHACKMESKTGNVRFKRAMLELQCHMVLVHFGAEQETAAWPSSRFELTARAFPRQVAAARSISSEAARCAIAHKYLEQQPTASPATLMRLLGWTKAQAVAACGAET